MAFPKTEPGGRPSILPLAVPLQPVGARGRIGLLVLATDVNSERDLHRMAPAGVEIFTNRIANANPVTMENHRAMAGDITRAARGLLPGNRIDVVAFGCTTATAALGEAKLAEAIHAGRPDLPCTNPITATCAALTALEARRISMLTPYTAAVNAELAAYLERQGVCVLNIVGFDLDRDDDMTAVPPAAILAAGLQVCDPRADVLFVACTAMRTSDVLDELERSLNKPVVASNQALLWHSLRLIGHRDPLAGFGRLLAGGRRSDGGTIGRLRCRPRAPARSRQAAGPDRRRVRGMTLVPPRREIALPFERSEYEARIAKARRAMDERGIGLVIVTDPANMAWLTGYDGWSFYVHQCVLLALDHDPIWFGRLADANGARRTVFMSHDHIIGYPDHYVQSAACHPMDYLSAIIESRGWAKRTLGVEMDNYYFSAACFDSLRRHLPNARFADATGLVNWQRAVKSAREIAYMRRAARIVEAMHARILELIEPGLPKHELAAEVYRTAIRGIDDYGGDYPSIAPLMPSGVDASAPHLTWDERPFRLGESTFFEIAGCYRRYHCPLSRTIHLGQPPQMVQDVGQVVIEGIAAALDAARPGSTCEEVDAAWRQVIARHHLIKETRLGYSIGLSYPPDWGERTMSLRPGDRTVLEEGMTFHLIPAIWQKDWGLEITESFLVTASGAEPFCTYPRRLLIKD